MIFGGGVSYSLKHSEVLAKKTEKRMLKVFPNLHNEKAEYIWGGYVGITLNRVPDIVPKPINNILGIKNICHSL